MSDLEFKLWFEKYGGWILIWTFSLIPIVMWLSINDAGAEFSNWYGAFSSLGKIFALVGFVLYAINLLLAVRRRWLENLFQGLNRVYIAHHITGGIALAFLVFHPFFLAIRYIDFKLFQTFGDAALFLWPRAVDTSLSYLEVQDAISINAGIIAFWGLVVLLILTFFVKLPYRLWLFTHRFLGVAFVFSILHLVTISSDTTQSNMLKWYLIIWGIIGMGAFLYRTVFGNVFVRRVPYKVSKVFVDDSMTRLELEPMAGKLPFKPGQFVFIRFLWSQQDGVIPEAHPFSIASGETEDGLRLYVKALGDFTAEIQKLHEGTVAEVEGAFGRFVPARYGTTPQVWIAGGIGVTPFLSMARSMQQIPQQIYLIYSVKTRSEMVETHVLAEFLPKHYHNFKFIPFVVDEQDGAFLSADFIEKNTDGLMNKEIFICGPPPMMKSLREQIRAKGVKNRKIHSEEFTMT
ncbi:ferric reductase-like transmembrane domain-containing protein [Candidatus Saccharibacteria bacterium]|nr:ferric reductase-like transmembrane domain-containing protein [Candidatus Saccharibacteria bacterium]MCB9821034.1 ferric reductase-like transmembrane domain-containing protein [Candidatus Nomurabacteria bacterium]